MARVSTYSAATSVSGGDHLYLVQNRTSFKVAVSLLGGGHTHADIVAQIASVSVALESRVAAVSVLVAAQTSSLAVTSAALATSIASAFSAIASVSVAVRANVAAVSLALATSIASHNHVAASITDAGTFGRTMLQATSVAAANALLLPVVTVSANITLTQASHESRFLLCVAAVNLTVDNSTDFSAQGFCVVGAEGGNVTFVNTATINRPGTDTLVLQQYGEAMLRRTQTVDVYTLKGTLGTA